MLSMDGLAVLVVVGLGNMGQVCPLHMSLVWGSGDNYAYKVC